MNKPDPGYCSRCGARRIFIAEKTHVYSEKTGELLFAIYVKCPKAMIPIRGITLHDYDYAPGLDGCFLHTENCLLDKGYF